MPDLPRYVVLGRGRWAGVVHKALEGERRSAAAFTGTRRLDSESDSAYAARLKNSLAASGAGIAWLCVPPGPHVSLMILAALDAGLDVIAESPWLCSPEISHGLAAAAAANRRLVGVHFEYCLLDEVESWRRDYHSSPGLVFGGRFVLSRPNRRSIPPLSDLGPHLAAVREYAVPAAALGELDCRYAAPGADSRQVWLDRAASRLASIDFTSNRQPIVQRFFQNFEAARSSRDFPFDLAFADRVSARVSALAAAQKT